MRNLILVGIIVLGVSLLPLITSYLGMNYGSTSQGGAGAHFASWSNSSSLIRIDINTFNIITLLGLMAVLHYRITKSRFTLFFACTLAMAGLADTIQIIPLSSIEAGVAELTYTTVWSSGFGRFGAAVLLLFGTGVYRLTRQHSRKIALISLLIPGISLLGLIWSAMLNVTFINEFSAHNINLSVLAMYLLIAVMLRPMVVEKPIKIFSLGIVASVIPLAMGTIWMSLTVTNSMDAGFHIAALLKWFGWLMTAASLSVDYMSAFYLRGLNHEKQFLRYIVDAIPHFIYARNSEGQFTLANKAVAEFYGQPVEHIEGNHLYEVHNDRAQSDAWLKEDQETLASEESHEAAEEETSDATGKKVWVASIKKPIAPSQNSLQQVLGVSIDITRRRQAENAVADRLIFELTTSAILETFVHTSGDNFDVKMAQIMELVGDFAEASRSYIYQFADDEKSAELLFSWGKKELTHCPPPPPELTGKSLSWIRDEVGSRVNMVAGKATDLPSDVEQLKCSTTNPESSYLAVPIYYQDRLFGFLGIDSPENNDWHREQIKMLRTVVDLFVAAWAKQEMEDTLVAAMEAAQDSSKSKTEFLANMSHEIRTPMNCVIGLTDLLLEMKPSPQQRQYLDMISQSGASLLNLINDILDLSKIEAGAPELDPVDTNFRELIEDITGINAFNAQSRGLEMICRLAPGVPEYLVCDPGRLRQVLTNLLNNATKFTQSGHVYLAVEPVGMENGDMRIRFDVSDTGIGIPEEKLEHIFEKFTQADAGTTRRFGGTGLGLSISRHFAKLMGGELTATSKLGNGSTFTFTILCKPSSEQADPVFLPTTETSADNTPKRVLLVSPHQLSGEVVAEQIRYLGYECDLALGCTAAGELLEASDLENQMVWSHVFVDYDTMNHADPAVANRLGKLPNSLQPKIALLTDLTSVLQNEDISHLGIKDVLTKPIRTSALSDLLLPQDLDLKPNELGSENKSDGVCTFVASPENEATNETQDTPNETFVLLAEDNPFNQTVAVGMLKLVGCRVEVANNGAEALAKIMEQNFDLVFMDCQMPEMDGYEATRQIRQLPGDKSSVPVVAMTANVLSGDKLACYEAGMNDFMSKPITKTALSNMLAKWEQAKAPV